MKKLWENLKEKHPTVKAHLQGQRKQLHPVIYRRITGEMVGKTATETKGAAGPPGMDANTWQKLLTAGKRNLS